LSLPIRVPVSLTSVTMAFSIDCQNVQQDIPEFVPDCVRDSRAQLVGTKVPRGG
jgi:hypothetical protein